MRVNRHSRHCWPLAIACLGWLSGGLAGEETQSVYWEPICIEEPLAAQEMQPSFGLQYSVQPGETLLIANDGPSLNQPLLSGDPVVHANYWEGDVLETELATSPPAKSSPPLDDNDASQGFASGLFGDDEAVGASNWSSTLDSAAENRVDAAVRSAGVAIVVLSLLLVGFLSWHRLRNTKAIVSAESSELTERGRLPITQTCRLHLVRAGACDVLVAVDRGSVKALTPLPADFSQLASLPFDSNHDELANGS